MSEGSDTISDVFDKEHMLLSSGLVLFFVIDRRFYCWIM